MPLDHSPVKTRGNAKTGSGKGDKVGAQRALSDSALATDNEAMQGAVLAAVEQALTNVNTIGRFVDLVADKLSAAVNQKIQASLQQALADVADLRKELTTLKKDFKEVKEDSLRRDDELEQYQRRNNLRVFGIEESDGEDTDQLLLDLFKDKLNVDVQLADIDRSHRVGKPSTPGTNGAVKPRAIIVKFTSYRTRRAVFSVKKRLRGSKVSISEDLTRHRYNLLRQATEEHGRGNVWSSDGRITWVIDRQRNTFGRATWAL